MIDHTINHNGITIGYSQREVEISSSELDDLQVKLDNRWARTTQRNVAQDTLEVVPNNGGLLLRTQGNTNGASLNYHSFGQLWRAAAPDGSRMARTTPANLLAPVLNHHLQNGAKSDGQDTKLILTKFDDQYVVRGIAGPTYGLIGDAQVLHAVRRAITGMDSQLGGTWIVGKAGNFGARGQARFPSAHVSDSGFCLNLIDVANPIEFKRPDGVIEILYRCLQVRNSEVGTRGLLVRFTLIRYDCANLTMIAVLGEYKVYMRHTSGAPSRFFIKVQPAIQRFTALPAAKVNDFLTRMYSTELADDAVGARRLLSKKGYNAKMSELIVARSEADQPTVGGSPYSAWGLLNAATSDKRSYIDDTIDAADTAGKVFSSVL